MSIPYHVTECCCDPRARNPLELTWHDEPIERQFISKISHLKTKNIKIFADDTNINMGNYTIDQALAFSLVQVTAKKVSGFFILHFSPFCFYLQRTLRKLTLYWDP